MKGIPFISKQVEKLLNLIISLDLAFLLSGSREGEF